MIVASRYAKSILGLAIEKNQLEDVYKDMLHIKNTCDASRDLVVFMKSPVITLDKKEKAFETIFSKSVSKLTMAYLRLLANKKRAGILAEVSDAFVVLYNKHKNITKATITTAVKLDKKIKEQALNIIQAKYSGSIELEEKVNPEIIGGFIIRVDDEQVDNSVARQLMDLKKNFNTQSLSIN
ncbi:MAG: ATP synthase F1 subunit delta [Bacteroidia bacterium]